MRGDAIHWKPNLIQPGQPFRYSRSITLHLDSPGTMSYHLSTRRSMIFTTERHNLYSALTFRVSISFKHKSKRTISKQAIEFLDSSVFWIGGTKEKLKRERKKEKKVVDRRRCHGYEFEFLVNRPVFDSKLCHARALTYAHAHAHGSEASRESKESRVIGQVGARRASFSFFRRISIANGYR